VSQAADQPEPPPDPDIRTAPVRPALSSSLPTPLDLIDHSRPRSIKFAVWLWVLGALAGLAVLAYFGTRFPDVRDAVRQTVRDDNPTRSAASVDRIVNTIMAVTFGLIVVPPVLILLLTPFMACRRNGARILLAIVGVPAPLVATVAVALMTVDTGVHPVGPALAVSAQAVLVASGLIAMFRPKANAWYRSRPLRP